MITVWKSIADAHWRGGYERILKARGYSAAERLGVMGKLATYVNRLKTSPLIGELCAINTREEFKAKLKAIFEGLWAGYIKESYKDIPQHFYDMLDYMTAAQIVNKDYYNEEEKNRWETWNVVFPATELTEWETVYLKDGKLTTLMNPGLLRTVRDELDIGKTLADVKSLCYRWYMYVLPDMKASDYGPLIDEIWNVQKKAKGRIKGRKVRITEPDGTKCEYGTHDALVHIIEFYGPENIQKKKVQIRGYDMIVQHIPFGKDEYYEKLPSGFYFCIYGNFKDRYNTMNIINMMLGKPGRTLNIQSI